MSTTLNTVIKPTHRTVEQLLEHARSDSDPVSMFTDGSGWDDAGGAVFVVKTAAHARRAYELLVDAGLVTEGKPVAAAYQQPAVLFDPARLPAPCDMGFFMHPDVPDSDEGQDITPLLAALGYDCAFMSFEADAGPELLAAWFDDDDDTVAARWTPTTPAGDGWTLVGKYDTEDGAYALFVRPSAEVAHG